MLKKLCLFVVLTIFAVNVIAGSPIRGAKEGAAIDGYDTVAYFSGKAIKGSIDYPHEWSGAKWLFSSKENRDQFAANPEKYAPQYGGHCARGMISNYLSLKGYDGQAWEVYDGKLYLFPAKSTKDAWVRRARNGEISIGDKNWEGLRKKLESE